MKRLIIALAGVATITGVSAQGGFTSKGLLFDKDIMTPSEMFDLSQTQFNFGTARAAAMAGAFTSLGADLSSMSINPAGLGMYRRSDISISPLLSVSRFKSNAADYGKNSRTKFGLANFGIAINLFESTKLLTSMTIGFGYNRLADFNQTMSTQRTGQNSSVADALSRVMAARGVSKNDFYAGANGSGDWDWNGIRYENWLGAMAYRAFMIDQEDASDPNSWRPTWIGNDALTNQYTTLESRGSIGEYNMTMSMNFSGKLYVGASLGIQSVYQKRYYDYSESYHYDTPSDVNPDFGKADLNYQMLESSLNQAVILEGTGVNFKLGVIYRPIAGLRIGAAFHTPTYYSLGRKYQVAGAGWAYANNHVDPNVKPDADGDIIVDPRSDSNMETPRLDDVGAFGWSFTSPARMLLGVSYAFGESALISVDYQRDWYNGIRMKDNPSDVNSEAYNQSFRQDFKGSNTVRVGAEFKPLPVMALRAGFGYNGSMLRDQNIVPNSPSVKQTIYYSAGIGFVLSRSCYLDFAYQYMDSKLTDYYLYYTQESEGTVSSALNSTSIIRHNIMMTLGFRF